MNRALSAFAIAASVSLGVPAVAVDLLVSQGVDPLSNRYYGGEGWSNVTAEIDATFDNVVIAPDLTDLGQMLSFDHLWVDQRWLDGVLTQPELENLAAFIDTGRRLVFIGENDLWEQWNDPFLELLGGDYIGESFDTASPLDVPPLTDGVGQIELVAAGVASGGTPLFDVNWATLWGDNVVTVLDINVWQNERWSGSTAQFGANVVDWLSLPSPGVMGFLALAVIGRPRHRNAPTHQ